MKYVHKTIALIVGIILVISCSDSPTDPNKSTGERGEVKQVELIDEYSAENIRQFFGQIDPDSPLEFTSDVSVYRVVYYSIDTHGNSTTVSGALMVPESVDSAPLFSLQHGTVFKRTSVASQGVLMASEGFLGVAFASAEYVTILPDYLGYGVSETLHPYVHSEGNANVVVDMIQATKSWCAVNDIPLNDQLFLGGYSEGGYVTMATQKIIESEYAAELPLTAVAPAAGPFDLVGFIDRVIGELNYPEPAMASFLLTAYNDIYGWNLLDDIFQSPYAGRMADLFDGSRTGEEISNLLPESVDSLLTQQFVRDLKKGELPAVRNAFQENTLLDWTPQAPIHLYHGTNDQLVDVQNSLNAYEQLSGAGAASIQITTYEGKDHSSAAEPAFNDMAAWFESFR